MVRIVCISDTHLATPDLPAGDILLHAGDLTFRGSEGETLQFLAWFDRIKSQFQHLVVIPGNHELGWEARFDEMKRRFDEHGLVLLFDEEFVCLGLKIWGTPITPRFLNWEFNRDPGEDIERHWRKIPDDTDILITHGPPFGIGDLTKHGKHVGCPSLLQRIQHIKPRLHLFGHIHEGYGEYSEGPTRFINAALMDVRYKLVHAPVIVDLDL